MRVQKHQYDRMLADPPIARGMADYNAGRWSDITDEKEAFVYEIGRLLAADIKHGLVKFISPLPGVVFVDLPEYDCWVGGDYHSKIGHMHPVVNDGKPEQNY